MIGVFARMFRRDERIVQVDELEGDTGYKIQALAPEGDKTVVVEEESSGFVDEVKYEGGNIVVAPLLEALLDNLHLRRRGEGK